MTLLANRRSAILLFSLPNCLESHRTRIVIKEKEISAEIHEVDLNNIPEEVKILSPYDEYPSLVDRELVLQNSRVIIEYLDERFPHPPLLPVDPISRAKFRLALNEIEHSWYTKYAEAYNDEVLDDKKKNMNGKLELVECTPKLLCSGNYIATPEVGDMYLFPNYLLHTVYPFTDTEEERRSVSFNAIIDEPTASL